MEPGVQLPGAERPGAGPGGVLLAHRSALLLHTALPQPWTTPPPRGMSDIGQEQGVGEIRAELA